MGFLDFVFNNIIWILIAIGFIYYLPKLVKIYKAWKKSLKKELEEINPEDFRYVKEDEKD